MAGYLKLSSPSPCSASLLPIPSFLFLFHYLILPSRPVSRLVSVSSRFVSSPLPSLPLSTCPALSCPPSEPAPRPAYPVCPAGQGRPLAGWGRHWEGCFSPPPGLLSPPGASFCRSPRAIRVHRSSERESGSPPEVPVIPPADPVVVSRRQGHRLLQTGLECRLLQTGLECRLLQTGLECRLLQTGLECRLLQTSAV